MSRKCCVIRVNFVFTVHGGGRLAVSMELKLPGSTLVALNIVCVYVI